MNRSLGYMPDPADTDLSPEAYEALGLMETELALIVDLLMTKCAELEQKLAAAIRLIPGSGR